MKTIATIFISAITSVAAFYIVYNFVPQTIITLPRHQTYGSTITTINGSDTISGSRATINTNFANLNADKIEATQTTLNSLTSATALASIGTITTGIWHGSIVDTAYGGTGSSTLAQYQHGMRGGSLVPSGGHSRPASPRR